MRILSSISLASVILLACLACTVLVHDSVEGQGLSSSPWPKYKGDTLNTGCPLSGSSLSDWRSLWSYDVDDRITASAVVGNSEIIYFGCDDGKLYALNPDGTLRWTFETGDAISSAPAIARDGTIYVSSRDRSLYAVNPNGTQKWSYEVGRTQLGPPAIHGNGNVIVGAKDKYVAVNPEGALEWELEVDGYVWKSCPAIAYNGTIYVVEEDGHHLFALGMDGEVQWDLLLPPLLFFSPVVARDGTIYVCGWWGRDSSSLFAIHPDGTEWWTVDFDDLMAFTPSVDFNDVIYVGTRMDDKLFAITPEGEELWNVTPGDFGSSSPCIDIDNTVYVGTNDRGLVAIGSDGTEKWNFWTEGELWAAPAMGEISNLYFGDIDGHFHALGREVYDEPEPTEEVTIEVTVIGYGLVLAIVVIVAIVAVVLGVVYAVYYRGPTGPPPPPGMMPIQGVKPPPGFQGPGGG